MQDKKTAIAIFLSILVILTYTEVFLKPTEIASSKVVSNSESTKAPTPEFKNSANSSLTENIDRIPEANPIKQKANEYQAIKNSDFITIETEKILAKISLTGGRLISYELKEYYAELNSSKLVNIIKTHKDSDFPLGLNFAGLSDALIEYNPNNSSKYYKIKDKETVTLNLSGTLTDGVIVNKTIKFDAKSYLFDLDVSVNKEARDNSNLKISWIEAGANPEDQNRYNPQVLTNLDGSNSLDRENITEPPVEAINFETKWIAFGDNYFTEILISRNTSTKSVLSKKDSSYFLTLEGVKNKGSFSIYAGPKEYKSLKATGFKLQRTIDLGWFAFIGQPILVCLNFLYGLLGNYGLAIVLFTILLKLALLPLTKVSFKSMRAMQDLQPELKALKKRAEDPAKFQQESLALYKKHGVNPLGGCLPMIPQIPILFGILNALRSSIDLRHTPFALWVQDLAAPEALTILGVNLPIMVFLMGASMFFQQLVTPTATTDPAQKRIMYLMPVMMTVMFIIFPFPSGLTLYWLVSNIITVIQSTVIRSDKNISPTHATIVGGVIVFVIAYTVTLI